jgi:WD40 repeat protein
MIVIEGHGWRSSVWGLAFAPDGRTLASCGGGKLRLWDFAANTGRALDGHSRHATALSFAPDGQELAVLALGHLWRGRLDGEPATARHVTTGHPGQVAYSPDGRFLACGNCVWEGRKLIASGSDAPPGLPHGLAFAPDGTLAVARWLQRPGRRGDNTVHLTDPATGRLKATLTGHTDVASCLAFRPDGAVLAAACRARLLAWDVVSGRQLTRIALDRKHFQAVTFTPDGRFLAAVRNDATARFWDAHTWQPARAFEWGIGPLVSLALAPDGLRAAAGSKTGKVVVWDLDL